DSGNGFHARYAIDLANDAPARDLVKRVLEGLAARFSNDRVTIDTALSNAARIIKLYGTMARKGDHTADRPHRSSRVISAPDRIEVVPIELLERFAAEYQPAPQPEANGPPGHGAREPSVSNGTGPEARAKAYLFAAGFPDSIAGEHGHNRLYRVACELVDGFGLARDQALPILREWNQAKAHPPESEYQVNHKLDDAIKSHPVPSLQRLVSDPDAS